MWRVESQSYGEFRGVDASQVPEQTSTKAVSEKASPATTKNEQETASNQWTRGRIRKGGQPTKQSSLQPVVQRMMGTHVGTLQAKKRRRSRRLDSRKIKTCERQGSQESSETSGEQRVRRPPLRRMKRKPRATLESAPLKTVSQSKSRQRRMRPSHR